MGLCQLTKWTLNPHRGVFYWYIIRVGGVADPWDLKVRHLGIPPHHPTSQRTFSKMQLTPIAANQTEIETADARIFFSYRTPVAAYIFGRGYVKSNQWYSTTTSRHINKWMGKDVADTCDTVTEIYLRGLAWWQNWSSLSLCWNA